MRAPPSASALAALALMLAAMPAPAEEPREPPPAAPVEEAPPRLSDVRWQLAPIRWRGLLAADVRSFQADGQPSRSQHVESASIQGVSYVYQPWFAQVGFGLTGLTSKDRGEDSAARSNSLGGNASLDVFPTSRFPFQARFDRSDSRSSDQFTGQQFTSTRLGARQSYRNLAGDQNTSASFDRSTLDSSSFGRDRVDVWNANHLRRFDEHSLEGNANRVYNSRGALGEALSERLFARHNYASDGLVSVETLASYGASTQTGAPGSARLRNDSVQLNSFGTWRRSDDDPLYVTGGARFFQSNVDDGVTGFESRSIMGNAAATYRMSPNLVINGGGSVTQISGTGAAGTLATQFAGAVYTADPRRWGEYLYTASLSANATNQSGGEGGGRRLLSGQGSHGLQRTFDMGPGRSLWLNGSQSLAAQEDSAAGATTTFTNFGGASYRVQVDSTLAGFASVSASDARSWGAASSDFQLVNLQLSGQVSFGRYSSLTADYTVQGTRERGNAFDVSANGGVTYQHARAFGVPQLRYFASYQRNDFQLSSRAQGDLEAPREQFSSSLEQRLEYLIGKLSARLSYRVGEIGGKKNALLYLRLAREFGD